MGKVNGEAEGSAERVGRLQQRISRLQWALAGTALASLASLALHLLPGRDLSVGTLTAERLVVNGPNGEQRALLEVHDTEVLLSIGSHAKGASLSVSDGRSGLSLRQGVDQEATLSAMDGVSGLALRSAQVGKVTTAANLRAWQDSGVSLDGHHLQKGGPSARLELAASGRHSAALDLARYQESEDGGARQWKYHNQGTLRIGDHRVDLRMSESSGDAFGLATVAVTDKGQTCLTLRDRRRRHVHAGSGCELGGKGTPVAEPVIVVLDAEGQQVSAAVPTAAAESAAETKP